MSFGRAFSLFMLTVSQLFHTSCNSYKAPPLSDNELRVKKEFKNQKIKPEIIYYEIGDRKISTLQIGSDTLPITILLHGSPGSGSDYDAYLKDSTLYQKSRLIVVDRPGYGFSDFGRIEVSVVKQAEIIQEIIKQTKNTQKVCLVGYSFGAPVAAKLAMLMPKQTKAVLMISGAVAPGEEKTFNISYLIEKKKWEDKLPIILRNANAEKLGHRAALEEITNDWDKITAPVTMLHGTKDNLIFYSNIDFVKKKLTNAKLDIVPMEGEGHGAFFSKTALVIEYIKKISL